MRKLISLRFEGARGKRFSARCEPARGASARQICGRPRPAGRLRVLALGDDVRQHALHERKGLLAKLLDRRRHPAQPAHGWRDRCQHVRARLQAGAGGHCVRAPGSRLSGGRSPHWMYPSGLILSTCLRSTRPRACASAALRLVNGSAVSWRSTAYFSYFRYCECRGYFSVHCC